MKYTLTFLFLAIVSISSLGNVSAREIQSFKDSDALIGLTQFLYDVGEDLEVSLKISDKKVTIKDTSKCTTTAAGEALTLTEKAVMKVLRFYPDEDVPFEQAMIDLADYLNNVRLKKCLFEKVTKQSLVKTTYFEDASGKIHLRIDTIQLKSE
jgi:hypothetical protein